MIRLTQPLLYHSFVEKKILINDPYEELKKATFNYLDHHTEIKNSSVYVKQIVDDLWRKITQQNNLKSSSAAVFIPVYSCQTPFGHKRYIFIAQPGYAQQIVEFCKGAIDFQENIETACLRELKEETQLNIDSKQLHNGYTYNFSHDNRDFHVYIFQIKQYQFEEMTQNVNQFGAISKMESNVQYFIDIDQLNQIQQDHDERFITPFNDKKLRQQLLEAIYNLKDIYLDNYLPEYVLTQKQQFQVFVSQ